MEEGIVKWFDQKKGFGFIEGKDGKDLFVHYSSIQGQGFRTLQEGQHVRFDPQTGSKGPAASNVVVL